MIIETTQLLNNARIIHDPFYDRIYKQTHMRHPASLWASDNKSNFEWLNDLGLALCKEYTYRYNRIHKCQQYLEFFKNIPFDMPNGEMTPFVQCMPEKYRQDNAIEAYREFYRNEKRSFAKWKKRPTPLWWY